jgi:hypothetical protein
MAPAGIRSPVGITAAARPAALFPAPDTVLLRTLPKKPLPPGRQREWYESHNRRLKAMRLAIALLDDGVHRPEQAYDQRIRETAARIGVRRPSDTTCRLVRRLMRY